MRIFTALLFCVVIATTSFAETDAKAAIVNAAEKYVAANSVTSGARISLEKVDGNYARAKVTPRNANATDPAWIFLKKQGGKWTGLALGTGFAPEDYRELGIPRSLWIQ